MPSLLYPFRGGLLAKLVADYGYGVEGDDLDIDFMDHHTLLEIIQFIGNGLMVEVMDSRIGFWSICLIIILPGASRYENGKVICKKHAIIKPTYHAYN